MISEFPSKVRQILEDVWDSVNSRLNVSINIPREYLDAFERVRVSTPTTLFDAQQEYGLHLQRTWDATANGTLPTIISPNGSVTSGSNAVGPRDTNTKITPITVSSTNGHYSVLQSRQYTRYVPSKGHSIFITVIFSSSSSK